MTEDQVVALLDGSLPTPEAEAVRRHLDACADCRQLVAAAAGAAVGHAAASSLLSRGALLGRHVVLEPLGAGAMGIVYAAYDPELERRVAVKVLWADTPGADEAARAARKARLKREAQALAQLAHPHVVTVYDVGTTADDVYLAMELLPGGTLSHWLRAEKRGWREVLRLYQQAALGLAAAHQAGLVHRDFKPENVLLGADGRARITDFGLVRPTGSSAAGTGPGAGTLAGTTLTRTGMLVGTPAYMAPEQLEGKPADRRTDVFAFSVALYEGLYGERPFKGATAAELQQQTRNGSIPPAPKGSPVPPWLRSVVLKGLRPAPEDRYESMQAMLAALDSPPLLTGRRVLAGLALGVFLATGVAAWARRSPADLPCQGGPAAFGASWDSVARERTRTAFEATGMPTAAREFAAVDRALTDYRTSWVDAYRNACAATRIRHDQSEASLERRTACLEDRRREAAAFARVLGEADRDLVNRAATVVGSLPDVGACADAVALEVLAPPPKDLAARQRFDRLAEQVADLTALEAAGKVSGALAALPDALKEARAIGSDTFRARLALLGGKLAVNDHSRYADAEGSYHEAAEAALRAHDDGTAVDAWIDLIRLTGFYQSKVPEARRWAAYAEAGLARLGGDGYREGLRELYLASTMAWHEERADEALGLARRARDLILRSRGPDHFRLASADEVIAAVLSDEGKHDEALSIQQHALALRLRVLGPDHIYAATSRLNVATELTALGRLAEAGEIFRAIDAQAPETRGAYFYGQEALFYRALRQPERALLLDEQALAQSADDLAALTGKGEDLLALRKPADAAGVLEKALAASVSSRDFERAGVELALSQALWDGEVDRRRARTLAQGARTDALHAAARLQGGYQQLADTAERWLAAHRE